MRRVLSLAVLSLAALATLLLSSSVTQLQSVSPKGLYYRGRSPSFEYIVFAYVFIQVLLFVAIAKSSKIPTELMAWVAVLAASGLGAAVASDDPADTILWLQSRVFWSFLPNAAVFASNLAGAVATSRSLCTPIHPARPSLTNLLCVTMPFLACVVFVRMHLAYALSYLMQRQDLAAGEEWRVLAWLLATDYRMFLWITIVVGMFMGMHVPGLIISVIRAAAKKLFKECDSNNSGELDYEEIADHWKYWFTGRRSLAAAPPPHEQEHEEEEQGGVRQPPNHAQLLLTFIESMILFYVQTHAISVVFLVVSMALCGRPASRLHWCLPLGRVSQRGSEHLKVDENTSLWAFFILDPTSRGAHAAETRTETEPQGQRLRLCLQTIDGTEERHQVLEAALQDVVVFPAACRNDGQDGGTHARCGLQIPTGTGELVTIVQRHDPVQRALTHKVHWCSLLKAAIAARGKGAVPSHPDCSPTMSFVDDMAVNAHLDHELSTLGARRFALRRQCYMLVAGCVSGLVGIWAAIFAGYEDLTSGDLIAWPSSLSEAMSDFETGRGRVFFGFLFVSPLLIFASWFPYALNPRRLFQNNLQPEHIIPAAQYHDTAKDTTTSREAVTVATLFVWAALCVHCSVRTLQISVAAALVAVALYYAYKIRRHWAKGSDKAGASTDTDADTGTSARGDEESDNAKFNCSYTTARCFLCIVALDNFLRARHKSFRSCFSSFVLSANGLSWSMCCLRQLTAGPSLLLVAIAPATHWVHNVV